jgi:hypothetical protein
MIATSPLYMIQTYKTNTDFYKISAVTRAANLQKRTAREPQDDPIQQSAYYQFQRNRNESSGRLDQEALFRQDSPSPKSYTPYQAKLKAYFPQASTTGLSLDLMI